MRVFILCIMVTLGLSGCVPPGAAIYERHRLAGLSDAQAEINAIDMERYILLNEGARLRESNDRTTQRYLALLSVASNPEEGAALMGQYTLGLEANRQAFVSDVTEALKLVERQRLVGRAVTTINEMADKEAAIARRTFDIFVENELPRLIEETANAAAQIEEHRKQRKIEEEIARAQREADRKRLAELEAMHQEEPTPTPAPTPEPEQ